MKFDIFLMSWVVGIALIIISWQLQDVFLASRSLGIFMGLILSLLYGSFIYSYVKMFNERKLEGIG